MSITVRLADGVQYTVPTGGTLTLGRAANPTTRKDGSLPAQPHEHIHLDTNPHLSGLAMEVRDLGDRYALRCGENPESGRIEVSTEEHVPFGTTLHFDNEITLTRPETPLRICLYDEDRTVYAVTVEADNIDERADLMVGTTQVRRRSWNDIRQAPDWFLAAVALCRPLLPQSGPAKPPEYRVALRLFNRCKQLSPTTTYAFNQAIAEARLRVFLPEDAVFGRVAETAVRQGTVNAEDVTDMLAWADSMR
ncbi:MAG: hypothetical protein CSA58_11860 [Micrococcales bacterium]|nr:MAG: hypothetical protein CSB46_04880 [Micrococcales bacterium]PIE25975.1 MAG: hypothetical protein CSA58_11860 [Micrococcales bacterium]